ncbi:unnamed protein product [Effrenium voratum]|uniref:Uncharacterized protein n=1 Tax=Effrenium voratum TaxID=2562239 RepID=A0AA36J938_9DINO|nr:unnamed protein product [Effrenium voratum]
MALSKKASFLLDAVLKPQADAEKARRYFPMLRKWAETGKAYRGETFSTAEVEEAIAAYERAFVPSVQNVPSPQVRNRSDAEWWPRWALNKARGVEVLAPVKGKPSAWTPATPVAIGYRGQKKCFLFVKSKSFDMDCRKDQVRPVGGGKSAQQQLEELLSRGHNPERHPDWTDGSDLTAGQQGDIAFITPGVPQPGKKTSQQVERDASFVEALEDEYERMTLLRRSSVVKTSTCDHPDPLSEPRAAASIKLPELTERDILALPANVAQERLSSLQLETVCFAARRFRTKLPDGRTAGYVLGDGTGCGKGRVISALLYHLWNSGHRRSIWVSATSDLYYDACRDLQDLGADIPCIAMRKLPPSGPLDKKGTTANKELVRGLGVEGDGVIFLTYSLLVQTGQRREVFPCTLNSQEAKTKLLDALDERMRCGSVVNCGVDGSGRPAKILPGDRVVSVKNLREFQGLDVPTTVSLERVLDKKKPKAGEDAKDAKDDAKDAKDAKDGNGKEDATELTAWNSRLGQLVQWLGGGKATGLICFDEVHKAKNLVPDKDDKASTKTGLYVERLQQSCPNAPVLYVSATAATEVQHLGYMSRLGAWGAGTAFDTFNDFQKAIEANGVAAMEMFAMNMKAVGAMSCRALAYVGTEFQVQQNGMTEEQLRVYDTAAVFWQKLLATFRKFIHSKDLKETYSNHFFKKLQKKKNGVSRKSAKEMDAEEEDLVTKRLWQFYWGAQQRFFKALCNSAKVPAACVAAQEAVDKGQQVVISIWATGEARSRAKMERLKEETAGRVTVDSVCDGITEVQIKEQDTLKAVISCLYANLTLRSKLTIGGKQVAQLSKLVEAEGKRISRPEELLKCGVPCQLVFRTASLRRLVVSAHATDTKEPVTFELNDDDFGERVLVSKVLEGPASFRRAELEGWHIKRINDKPVGKIRVATLRPRLRKGASLAFQDPVIDEHLSGPAMIVEHFINSCFLTQGENGEELAWAAEVKSQLVKEAQHLSLPPNALDDVLDRLGGLKKVGEMSGRSHRIKRRKDGSLAWVARCEELRCPSDGANLVEQVLFQKGSKKICVVTEVASAGISLHADRRQVTSDFRPPRRLMISLELPWGADKAIQCFGRVHRANQLVPPKFLVLTTPLGGEVRFNSAIARRMKLLGAVTKGDRMTSMGGVADSHMTDFDVNNAYGQKALMTFYTDTAKFSSVAPELLALYEALPFIGAEGDGEASGRWPTWQEFVEEVNTAWDVTRLTDEIEVMLEDSNGRSWAEMGTKESQVINRFFNRILMLEVHIQNAMFETFFAVYTELVRVDKANGVYDEGIENLNRVQGRTIQDIKVDQTELLFRDPSSGAETTYVRLSLDRGITWEAAKAAYDTIPAKGSTEGFYEFRPHPEADPVYILVKETLQLGGAGSTGTTWVARRRRRQFSAWRADCGAVTSWSEGRKAYFESDFEQDCFTRIYGTDEELETVREGWMELYRNSAASRTVMEHVLTGDVLAAWQLVRSGKSKETASAEGPKLQIVRAITQPGNLPVVGMRLDGEDIPHLRYVLSCQQEAAQEPKSSSIKEVALQAGEMLLEHLSKMPDYKMPFTSWLEVHKVLPVPRSIDGLRGTQMAVEKLRKARLVKIEEGEMTWCLRAGGRTVETEADLLKPLDPPLKGEDLEELMFPQAFLPRGADSESDDFTEEEEEEADAQEADLRSCEQEKPQVGKEDKDREPKRRKLQRPAEKDKVAGRVSKKKALQALFEEDESEEESQPKDESQKRERDEQMERLLFDEDSEEETNDQELKRRRRDEPGSSADPGSEATTKAQLQEWMTLAVGPPKSDSERLAKFNLEHDSVSQGALLEGQLPEVRWEFEVIGNKIGIRDSPDITTGSDTGEYLRPNAVFVVSEKVLGQDGRTYLRLADGRGEWPKYDVLAASCSLRMGL